MSSDNTMDASKMADVAEAVLPRLARELTYGRRVFRVLAMVLIALGLLDMASSVGGLLHYRNTEALTRQYGVPVTAVLVATGPQRSLGMAKDWTVRYQVSGMAVQATVPISEGTSPGTSIIGHHVSLDYDRESPSTAWLPLAYQDRAIGNYRYIGFFGLGYLLVGILLFRAYRLVRRQIKSASQ